MAMHFTIDSEPSTSPNWLINLTKSEGLRLPDAMVARSLSILSCGDSSKVAQKRFCRFLYKSFRTSCLTRFLIAAQVVESSFHIEQ